jgi:hypothetical protein
MQKNGARRDGRAEVEEIGQETSKEEVSRGGSQDGDGSMKRRPKQMPTEMETRFQHWVQVRW